MKTKIISLTAVLLMGFTMLVGSTGVAVATAEPAQAVTKSSCYYYHTYFLGQRAAYKRTCYYNYSWWEEVWQGKRDGWKTVQLHRHRIYGDSTLG